MRIAVDTGGTFTDLVVEEDTGYPPGVLRLYKSSTTPDDPVRGILDVLDAAARDMGINRHALLNQTELFFHATTRAINAILTGNVARTAFLTTKGHPDILLFREGGRSDTFNHSQVYPLPYIPRALTFEIPERVAASGVVVTALDEPGVRDVICRLEAKHVEAVAVCLLWSIANPKHELRIGEMLDHYLPGVPYTLSHALNTTMREYRRASSTAIDASLKPVMAKYLHSLDGTLRDSGFVGRLLVVTSSGGVLDAASVADAPIHSIGSGPAMAPVAGRYYARLDANSEHAVIADTGGTSYDVSLVRHGRIPVTRETWLGPAYSGHMTGFPSIDVKSIGAGGGSIAWVDEGGLLHVGPQSAGANPGPVCYGAGGAEPTVTDACLVLGYLDPDYFLGGEMQLKVETPRDVIAAKIGRPLNLSLLDAAAAILAVATERMVNAIEDITVNQGIDPRSAVLVAGGGAAGLNAVAIARRLGCNKVIIPDVAAALSAAGALMSDLSSDFAAGLWTTSSDFDYEAANRTLSRLEGQCRGFIDGPGAGAVESRIEFSAEAHYPHQAWELEVPLRTSSFDSPNDVEQLRQDFHTLHREVFAVNDPQSSIEIVALRARARCVLRRSEPAGLREAAPKHAVPPSRAVYWQDRGTIDTPVRLFHLMQPGEVLPGPAIIESPVTTVIVEPGASVHRTASGSLSILPTLDTTPGPRGTPQRVPGHPGQG